MTNSSNSTSQVKKDIDLLIHNTDYQDTKHPLDILIEKPNIWLCCVGVILSANTTDKAVNKIMPAFRQSFPSYQDILKEEVTKDEIIKLLPGINHSGSKADYLINVASRLNNNDGELPKTIKEFTKIKGIGRKTAAVILYNVYGIDEGFPLDTHCMRILKRLGWYNAKSPKAMENKLLEDFPEGSRYKVHMTLTNHGRAVCKPANPLCESCFLKDSCQYYLENV